MLIQKDGERTLIWNVYCVTVLKGRERGSKRSSITLEAYKLMKGGPIQVAVKAAQSNTIRGWTSSQALAENSLVLLVFPLSDTSSSENRQDTATPAEATSLWAFHSELVLNPMVSLRHFNTP